jgi:hypothetical protein
MGNRFGQTARHVRFLFDQSNSPRDSWALAQRLTKEGSMLNRVGLAVSSCLLLARPLAPLSCAPPESRWRKRMRRAVLTTAALSLLLLSGVANAQPALLAPGTHPMWASLALGPAISVKDSGTQFKLIETFGNHLMGSAAGPAIAFDMQEALGNKFSIELGPKFLWDIQPVHNLGLYLAPSFMIGYQYAGSGGGLVGRLVLRHADRLRGAAGARQPLAGLLPPLHSRYRRRVLHQHSLRHDVRRRRHLLEHRSAL